VQIADRFIAVEIGGLLVLMSMHHAMDQLIASLNTARCSMIFVMFGKKATRHSLFLPVTLMWI
jgi:hypothetical protein